MQCRTQAICFAWAILLAVGGCNEPQSGDSSRTATGPQTAERQAVRAAVDACMARIRQAVQEGAPASQIMQMRDQCISQSRDILTPESDQRLSNDHSIYSNTARATVAAHNAEAAGDQQAALGEYKSIDANADGILSEVFRMMPSNRANAYDLLQQLATAEEKLGTYEVSVNRDYSAAAAYYEKAVDTLSRYGGVELAASTRLAFLYANGLGVPQNSEKAIEIFAARQTPQNSSYIELVKHGMLPPTPEEITPAILARLNEAEFQEGKSYIEQYRASHRGEIRCTRYSGFVQDDIVCHQIQ